MREVWLTAVLLLSAGLAGCLGEDPDAGSPMDDGADGDGAGVQGAPTLPDGTQARTEVRLAGCTEQAGAFPVPASEVEGEVPDGFELVPFSGEPSGQTATLVVISLSCALDGQDPASELWGFVQVQPPAELSAGEGVFHMVVLGAFTSDGHLAEVYRAWGLGSDEAVLHGEVALEVLQETPTGRVGHALAESQGFTVHLYSTVGGSPTPETAGEARIFGAAGGQVTGVVDLSWTDSEGGYTQGEATLAFEEDVPVPEPVGPGHAWHYWGESYDVHFAYRDLA